MNTKTAVVLTALMASSVMACGSIAPPFDTLKSAPVTVYRLQNFEPPPVAAATTPVPGATPGAPLIPGLPPEIQTWIQQGAQGMGSLIPPGLLPPGLIPGTGTATPAPAATPVPDAPRFEGFRILGQTQIMDQKLRDDLAELLGSEKNYDAKMSQCLYPELGISYQTTPPMLPDNVLVSFSCNRIEAKNFQWPFANRGLKQDTIKKFANITQQLFGGT